MKFSDQQSIGNVWFYRDEGLGKFRISLLGCQSTCMCSWPHAEARRYSRGMLSMLFIPPHLPYLLLSLIAKVYKKFINFFNQS